MYVVWSAELGAEEHHVGPGTTLIPDPRVRHYWDPNFLVGSAFAPIVGTGDPAWDVWMLFDRHAHWDAPGLPAPAWWEHQLGGLRPERHLDPERFAARAAALEQGGR